MPSSLIFTLLQECLMLKFMFVFIQVNFIQKTKFFNATPSLHVHLIIMIQFVCHFHIGCKTIFQLKFKFKFVFIQAFLILWIQTPIGLSLHHSCDNSQLFVLYVHNNCKNSFVYNICFSFISSSPISTLFAKNIPRPCPCLSSPGQFFSVWPWRPEALHSCDNSDSICLSFPHWLHEKFILNSISSSLISTCFC